MDPSGTARPDDDDVVVVGAGLVGLSSAWQLARRGVTVTVIDPDPGHGASWAAAGMLAPVTEATYGEQDLLELLLAGAQRWPAYAAELGADSGRDPGLREEGTLVLARDAGDLAELERWAGYAEGLGLPVQHLTGRECRAHEPLLAPQLRAGLLTGDHSAHNRQTVTALLAACENRGVRVLRQRVERVDVADGRVAGVRLADGAARPVRTVVVAAGAWSGQLLAGVLDVPVRPVRGTILRLGTPPDYLAAGGVLSRTVRGTVAGAHVYLVPRADGELVVGATSDEVGFDDRPTAGGVWQLLRDARELLPVVSELTFVEAWSGLRPYAPDNAPMVGTTGIEGLLVATGHGRNGVLLSPATADAVVGLVLDGTPGGIWKPFSPLRFTQVPVTQEVGS